MCDGGDTTSKWPPPYKWLGWYGVGTVVGESQNIHVNMLALYLCDIFLWGGGEGTYPGLPTPLS